MMALAAAKERGFKLQADVIKNQKEFSLATFRPKIKEIREGRGVGGGNTMASYGLMTFQVSGHGRDDTTAALVKYLLDRQKKDGAWAANSNRPPSEGSKFTTTGLAMECLKAELANLKEDSEKKSIEEAIERGLMFLKKNEGDTTEDCVFRLRGLVAGGAGEGVIAPIRSALQKQQRMDGGWSQVSDLESDAYATGTVLVALRKAGLKLSDAVYQRGLAYLCRTQDASGGWIVQTRSRPIQVYFDNGDPGGKSQFISTAATGWAVLALLQTVNPTK
jgi:N-acyl-D-amino-acid deacylase